MKLTIKIESSNAAFDDGNCGRNETARILRSMSWDASEDKFKLRDINGNVVGSFEFEADDDE